ncbi:MAG TPA: DUF4249 domain-containing protein [Bacteroidia bacterium]|jgi:hypothetical protein|nr:DUF4249 domain-containing protein [Bacteroidia bacterium]
MKALKGILKVATCILCIGLFSRCSKDVTLDVPAPTPQIVVEGHIEPNTTAYVYLSHNFAFFGNTTISSILANDVVHGAKMTVTDGQTTDSLVEVAPSIGYYTNFILRGQVGKTYTLKVVVNGQTLTSTTTILQPVKLDSCWFQVKPGLDSLGYMWAVFHDPPQPGNCYRWLAKRLGKDTTFVPPDESVFNDEVINGLSFTFYYDRGIFPGSTAPDDMNAERHYFKLGEKVVVKFCAIDNTAYQFYYAYYYQLGNNGNPFGSPTPVIGNINGGLGIWCGYGSFLDTVTCK